MNAPSSGSRRVALVALGLAVLGGLALLLFSLADAPAGPAAGPKVPGTTAAESHPAAGPAAAEPVPASAADAPDTPASPTASALGSPLGSPMASPQGSPTGSPTDWPDVRLAARISELGPALARDVYQGLQRARAALDGCYAAANAAAEAAPAAPVEDGFGAAIVTLQLEGRPGELVVVGAPLQELGTSSLALVNCCESVLRGFRIPAPEAVPGRRYRLQYQLVE